MGQPTTTKVQLYESDGVIIPSRMGSYLIWRQLYKGTLKPEPRGEDGICQICHGYSIIESVQYGTIWCLCHINEQMAQLKASLARYESTIKIKTLDELKPVAGNMLQIRSFQGVIEAVRVFCKSPTEWLALMGTPGTGKTHILSAIKGVFGPWALYLTASDFEGLVFEALKDESLQDMIEAIKKVPILLYDDLGSEYVREGKDFVRSNLRKIIDFRYKLPLEYPTVVATNLSPAQLQMYDARIMDRVLDQGITSFAEMNFPSWRTKGLTDANPK